MEGQGAGCILGGLGSKGGGRGMMDMGEEEEGVGAEGRAVFAENTPPPAVGTEVEAQEDAKKHAGRGAGAGGLGGGDGMEMNEGGGGGAGEGRNAGVTLEEEIADRVRRGMRRCGALFSVTAAMRCVVCLQRCFTVPAVLHAALL